MAMDQSVSVKDTVHKLQLSLLEGIQNEDQLFAAGSVMSRGDYNDVVTERSIANLCGYPLCKNSLPTDRPHKGRYRISLKEHKVYDLHETYMYCSSGCVVNSRAFAGSLHEERCSVLDNVKLNEVLRLFQDLSLDSEGLGKNGDLELSQLKIQEKAETRVREVFLEHWVGPSNAIEGYVPKRDRKPKSSSSKDQEGGSKAKSKLSSEKGFLISDADFTSTIITNDEYCISKIPSDFTSKDSGKKSEKQKGKGSQNDLKAKSSAPAKHDSGRTSRKSKGETSKMVVKEEAGSQNPSSTLKPSQTSSNLDVAQAQDRPQGPEDAKLSEPSLKPSLKSSGAKKVGHSVTWADEIVDNAASRNLCEVREMEDTKGSRNFTESDDMMDESNMLRIQSAEACAIALSQAAEAIASGNADIANAVSEAGVIILACSDNLDQGNLAEAKPEDTLVNWPQKSAVPRSEYFDPEDLWFDAPPEGFSLMLSPFATMWNAVFEWVTSSSLAFIYGKDENSDQDYLFVNGREYPRKIVLGDGRSSEIKQTVEGCLSRASPGLVADLRLSVPVSTLEKAMAQLLGTMSFVYALPALRMKQWQVIALLFIEALSICRIPALTLHATDPRMVLHKVLDGAHIQAEEYEVMKDLMLPLGKAPQFSAQSGA